MLDVKVPLKLHNRFDFEVRDAESGELKLTAKAENVVLNRFKNALLSASYTGLVFSHIHVGDGNGTPDPTRTTMFNFLHRAQHTLVERVYANPTSYSKYKIELNPGDLVGKNLTEIGLADYSYAFTHAMITDGEGNPISIAKTATDLITIYATIYTTINLPPYMEAAAARANSLHTVVHEDGKALQFMSVSLGSDASQKYNCLARVTQGTAPYDICINGLILEPGTMGAASPVYVNDTFARTFLPVRFEVSQGNCPLREVGIRNLGRIKLPAAGVVSDQFYVDVPLGTGDGVTKKFELPSLYVKKQSVITKVASTVTPSTAADLVGVHIGKQLKKAAPLNTDTDYTNPQALQSAADVVITKDAWAKSTICVWDAVEQNFVQYTNIDDSVSFSRADTFAIYRIDDNTFGFNGSNQWIQLDRVNKKYTLITAEVSSCKYGGSKNNVVGRHSASNVLEVMEKVSGNWVRRKLISPGANLIHAAFSDDGNTVVISHANGVGVYDWNGVDYIKRPDISGITSNGACFVNPSGTTIGVQCTFATRNTVHIWDWNGVAWAKRDTSGMYADIDNVNSVGYNNLYSEDLTKYYRTVYSGGVAYLIVHVWDGTSYKRIMNRAACLVGGYSQLNAAYGTSCATPYGLVVFPNSYNNPPYLSHGLAIYPIENNRIEVEFATAPAAGLAITASYEVNGIHKTNQYVLDVGVTVTM